MNTTDLNLQNLIANGPRLPFRIYSQGQKASADWMIGSQVTFRETPGNRYTVEVVANEGQTLLPFRKASMTFTGKDQNDCFGKINDWVDADGGPVAKLY